MPLEQLGPYKLEKVLGRGGMGAVYVGVDRESGNKVAVKVLSAHLADDGGFRERFKIEVETLKRLLHPNIVQLFGFGEEDGHLFYSMELVNGRSLQDELTSGRRFAWREVARIGVAVAQALKHAHDRGIIHRDLKPANLLLDEQDHIKLTDFGIAKLYGGTSVTADGGVLGTADYMSPEQAEGKQVTSRCDLYALGSVMYALLTGRPPFAGKTIVQVITALKNDPAIPVCRLAPDTPEEFENIVMQLLEKDPSKRIPTALALSNRLKAMEHALSLDTRIVKPGEPLVDSSGLTPDDPKQPAPSRGKTTASPNLGATVPLEESEAGEYRLAGETPAIITSGGSVVPSGRTQARPVGTRITGVGPAANSGTAATMDSLAPTADAASAESRATRFTTVSEAELRHGGIRRERDESAWLQWVAVGGALALALAVLGVGAFLATRSPSADQLYGDVKTAAEGGSDELLSVEDEMGQFLERFPADPRAEEVRGYQEALELDRLERRFELRARRPKGIEELLPVERAYLEAVQVRANDPEAALTRLGALVAVYGGEADSSLTALQKRASERCLELAKKQIEQLSSTVKKTNQEQRLAIRRQLERADKLAEADRAGAEKIWQGIVTLYAGKAWAKDLVEQAELELKAGEAAPSSASP
jgi:serine/threonine-protein kinase